MSSYQHALEKKLFFRHLVNTSSPGVYALVNEKHKKVFIVGTRTVYQSLGNIAQQLANRSHSNRQLRRDVKYLNFKMLEYCDSQAVLPTKIKWMHDFIAKGYQIYNTEKIPRYRFTTRILAETYKVQVVVKSAGKRVYPIKEFDTQREANEFIRTESVFECLKMIR